MKTPTLILTVVSIFLSNLHHGLAETIDQRTLNLVYQYSSQTSSLSADNNIAQLTQDENNGALHLRQNDSEVIYLMGLKNKIAADNAILELNFKINNGVGLYASMGNHRCNNGPLQVTLLLGDDSPKISHMIVLNFRVYHSNLSSPSSQLTNFSLGHFGFFDSSLNSRVRALTDFAKGLRMPLARTDSPVPPPSPYSKETLHLVQDHHWNIRPLQAVFQDIYVNPNQKVKYSLYLSEALETFKALDLPSIPFVDVKGIAVAATALASHCRSRDSDSYAQFFPSKILKISADPNDTLSP